MSKKINWFKIAESVQELQPIQELEVGNKTICIVVHNNNVHACAYKCPHAGGNMAKGYVDVLGNIVCPLHRYKFSLINGRNITGEGYYLKTYPIQVNEDGIFVGFEETTLF
jgi:nitrite reductase/ring-hydroxylating ferredoxin subunit